MQRSPFWIRAILSVVGRGLYLGACVSPVLHTKESGSGQWHQMPKDELGTTALLMSWAAASVPGSGKGTGRKGDGDEWH